MKAPRDDLIRSFPKATSRLDFVAPEGYRDAEGGDSLGRTMVGYPVVFDQWAEIDSVWEGHFLERFHPGSLNRTLEQRGDRIQVLFNHGFDPSIGDKPLGKPEIQEPRDHGLYTEVPLSRTSYNDDILELIRDGALWGQSVRFSVLDERWEDEPDPSDENPRGLPQRTIMEARMYEYGPVTFPAYEATTLGIRSIDAFSDWIRNRETPPPIVLSSSGTISSSDFVFLDDVRLDGTVSPSGSPVAPANSRIIELTRHRRDATIDDLSEFLRRMES